MASNKSNVVMIAGALLLIVLLECNAQTLTYSAGWVNGKRAPPIDHWYPSGPVPITEVQSGRNFVCFDINSQLKDTLVSFGLKSPDYPRPLAARPLLRTHGEE